MNTNCQSVRPRGTPAWGDTPAGRDNEKNLKELKEHLEQVQLNRLFTEGEHLVERMMQQKEETYSRNSMTMRQKRKKSRITIIIVVVVIIIIIKTAQEIGQSSRYSSD